MGHWADRIILGLDSQSPLPPGARPDNPVGFDPSGHPLFPAKPGERTCGECLHRSICDDMTLSGCWTGAGAEKCRHRMFHPMEAVKPC